MSNRCQDFRSGLFQSIQNFEKCGEKEHFEGSIKYELEFKTFLFAQRKTNIKVVPKNMIMRKMEYIPFESFLIARLVNINGAQSFKTTFSSAGNYFLTQTLYLCRTLEI